MGIIRFPVIFVSFTFVLFSHLFALAADSIDDLKILKIETEQTASAFIFDWGTKRGFLDRDDYVLDLLALCSGQRPADIPAQPELDSQEGLEQQRETLSHAEKILEKLQLTPIARSDNTALAKNYDSEKVFIVYPDIHQSHFYQFPPEQALQGELLHISQAYDFVSIVEALIETNQSAIFLAEGSDHLNYTYHETMPTGTKPERRALLEKIVRDYPQLISYDIAEVFRNILPAGYLDNGELLKSWMVHYFTHRAKTKGLGDDWATVYDLIDQNYGPDFANDDINLLKPIFDRLAGKSEEELKNLKDYACDRRSWYMAENANLISNDKSANVVLVRIGASHLGGFVQKLREKRQSHIVFSPNYSQ